MRGFFRNMLIAAPIAFLLLPLESNHNFRFGIGYVEFARAFDLDRSGVDRSREETKDGETTEGRGNVKRNDFFETLSTLEEVWSVLKELVPNKCTNVYIQPETNIVADFECIVLDMMTIGHRYYRGDEKNDEGDHSHDNCRSGFQSRLLPTSLPCDRIDLRSLKGIYQIGTFVDRENGRSYCILATTSILYPWGNVIVDLDASSATKNLSFDCPHPKYDTETGEQGIRMLKGTMARSFIVSGSHRMTNNRTLGTCQPQYSHYPSDVAHSIDNCFLAAVAAIKFYYGSVVRQDYTSVQLHGMGKTTCGPVDTFFSHGSCSETITHVNGDQSKSKPNQPNNRKEKIDILQNIARAYPFDNGRHAVAGRDDSSGGCKLCGSTNIQGRLINGVARKNLCDTFASSYNGQFVQIEQKREYRRESLAQFWNDVFNEAYPRFPGLVTVSTTKIHSISVDKNEKNSLDDEGFFVMDQKAM